MRLRPPVWTGGGYRRVCVCVCVNIKAGGRGGRGGGSPGEKKKNMHAIAKFSLKFRAGAGGEAAVRGADGRACALQGGRWRLSAPCSCAGSATSGTCGRRS